MLNFSQSSGAKVEGSSFGIFAFLNNFQINKCSLKKFCISILLSFSALQRKRWLSYFDLSLVATWLRYKISDWTKTKKTAQFEIKTLCTVCKRMLAGKKPKKMLDNDVLECPKTFLDCIIRTLTFLLCATQFQMIQLNELSKKKT